MNPQIASQFNQTPLLIDPKQVGALQGLTPTIDMSQCSPQELSIITGVSQGAEYKPYQLVDGIAIININGALIHKLGWSSSHYTGYDVIKRKAWAAAADPDVKGIYVPCHTPGGSAQGCPDTGDLLYEIGKHKPIWTLSDDMSYSAGQWLHSQGTRRLVTQSGGMGSVGVVIAHTDVSKALDEYGYKITLIHAGKHKVDGNPYEQLSKEVKTSLEAGCNSMRENFAKAVARGTGMDIQAVLDTEAECYVGQDAVDVGFAEEVVSSNTILSEFIEHVKKPKSITTVGTKMTQPNETSGANLSAATGSEGAEVNQPTATSQPTEQQAERTRIAGILNCSESAGRSEMANHLAFNTSMSVEDSVALLKAAPTASKDDTSQQAAIGSDAFASAMGNETHPNLSADAADNASDDIDSPEAQAAAIAADFKAAKGIN